MQNYPFVTARRNKYYKKNVKGSDIYSAVFHGLNMSNDLEVH